MNLLLNCLVTASVMLTIACGLAAIFFRRFGIVTPRMRQCVLVCVMLQGLMLFRMPVNLPWLESRPSESALVATRSAVQGGPSDFGAANSAGAVARGDFLAGSEIGTSSALLNGTDQRGLDQRGPMVASWKALVAYTALLIWLTGIVVTICRSLHRYVTLCRLIEHLSPAPEAWQTEWRRLCARRHRAAPEMLVSESAGPMLVRRPRGYALVVPSAFWDSLSQIQRRGVLLHELAHLCRRDVWRQLFVRFAAAFHWWNPATWWCVRRYEESAEWACDETLTREDPAAAKGLASSLVQLVEFLETGAPTDSRLSPGLGVQSMAAPPLTARVTRLLCSSPSGDSIMKRLLFVMLAAGLLTLSTIQFRLVAADPDDLSATSEVTGADDESGLRVLSPDSKTRLQNLRQRLNTNDKPSANLKALLGSESGQIALAGLINGLEGKYRDLARAEAVPRFVQRHFEITGDEKLNLRSDSRSVASSWVAQSKQLGETLDSMQGRMQSIADRIDGSTEADQMARRMLTDNHAAFAIMLEEFDGRSDPIDLFLTKALEKVLVKRGDKMIVIPTLGSDGQRQIGRFELATKVFEKLKTELPDFSKEFAKPDDRHEALIEAMNKPTMAAIVALHMTKDDTASASGTVDRLFEQLEQITRDTAGGLVIEDEKAVETLQEMVDLTNRVDKRIDAVKVGLARVASTVDVSDPMSARFAKQMRTGVIAYQVAGEIPYAELDLGKQVEGMISKVMEPVGANKLRVKQENADEVNKRAGEILTACRTIRRYLRRVDSIRDRMTDRELAESLEGPGRMVLFAEVRRSIREGAVPSIEILEKEMFTVDDATDELTVRPERVQVVEQLARRAKELEQELSKDDF